MTLSKAVNPQAASVTPDLFVCVFLVFRGEMEKIFLWLRPKTSTTDGSLPPLTSKKSLIRIKICTAASPNQSAALGCPTLLVLLSEVRIYLFDGFVCLLFSPVSFFRFIFGISS